MAVAIRRCSNIRGKVTPDPTFRYSRCLGTAYPIDGRPCDHVLDDHNLSVLNLCYILG